MFRSATFSLNSVFKDIQNEPKQMEFDADVGEGVPHGPLAPIHDRLATHIIDGEITEADINDAIDECKPGKKW